MGRAIHPTPFQQYIAALFDTTKELEENEGSSAPIDFCNAFQPPLKSFRHPTHSQLHPHSTTTPFPAHAQTTPRPAPNSNPHMSRMHQLNGPKSVAGFRILHLLLFKGKGCTRIWIGPCDQGFFSTKLYLEMNSLLFTFLKYTTFSPLRSWVKGCLTVRPSWNFSIFSQMPGK